MLTLALPLLLATVPCADLETDVRLLEETAKNRPAELSSIVAGIESRAGGLPLRPQGDFSTEQLAQDVAARLRETCAFQESSARPQASLPDSSPERLRAILDRPEFSQARRRNTDLLQRLLRQADAWLSGLFQSKGAQSFAITTRAIILGLGLAVVLFGVLRFRRWRRPATQPAAPAAEAAARLELDSPREHLQRAREALASSPREAIRQGLLSLLSTLEERQLARPDRVKTNRELAAELPSRGAPAPLVQEVERLVRWYDRTFYSLSPVPPDEAASFVADVERLQHTPPGGVA
ncbi:DUF4129 domain-containing protein [Hyalangium minutum]|uniref:Protein-glutamine gamma-glutamyltransferase-like C-terminal domain-containing protein n=1 Tax=Hyalangium minutum TaxID=394096 RepID=A0A085WG46_9BACT|nr:DUF4129 domain-containing protein [Hyalangium minutum]KFE66659.1 hypothetical protein DB31_8873 [Hyalangium minutum]